ncbi:MAG: 30S ribosomal protein S4 [Elusimicrobia bacterium]|nr:30S ribosomal protein S4 [Elusimicrobiota bacterium]
MSRYTGADCKRCRKLNVKLFLKGVKCYTKCLVDREKTAKTSKYSSPMQSKMSDYGKHLREKQIARFMAGVNEAQFKRLFNIASKEKGKTGEALLRLIESRLDNIVRRAGWAISLKAARQLVNHGHVKINGKSVNIPSYILKPGDSVAVSPKCMETLTVRQGMEHVEKGSLRPSFLSYDASSNTAKFLRWPDRTEFSINVDEQLIVEYYSK